MPRDFTIGSHKVRVSFIFYDWRKPYFIFYLSGPNGSSSGFGPKPWPFKLGRTGSFKVPMPYFSWMRAYRLRRVGGIRLHNLQQRTYRALDYAS